MENTGRFRGEIKEETKGKFRTENERDAKDSRNCGRRDSCDPVYRELTRDSCDPIYRELTRDGRRFCAAAALLEELLVLAVFGIRISTSPAPVLAFLWVLFAILTAAALIGASHLAELFGRFRTAARCVKAYGCAGANGQRAAAADRQRAAGADMQRAAGADRQRTVAEDRRRTAAADRQDRVPERAAA